jgi:DNA-binding NarL/FixJ family response regulator
MSVTTDLQHTGDTTTGTRTRVLIADDHPLILAGIRRALDRSDGVEVVGEATSGAQVLAMVERRRPEVVLLDLYMPGMSGAELIGQLHEQWPEVKMVVLSANEDRASIDSALNAGASAYIVKSVNPSDLSSVIRQVAGGAVFHAPSRPTGSGPAETAPAGPDLTDRERTILAAVASGQTTAAISRELWVSEHTIKFHLTNIYRKLGVNNRAGAVRFAIENGLAA